MKSIKPYKIIARGKPKLVFEFVSWWLFPKEEQMAQYLAMQDRTGINIGPVDNVPPNKTGVEFILDTFDAEGVETFLNESQEVSLELDWGRNTRGIYEEQQGKVIIWDGGARTGKDGNPAIRRYAREFNPQEYPKFGKFTLHVAGVVRCRLIVDYLD